MACTSDTDSIQLSVGDGELTADLIVSPADGLIPNLVTIESDGVFVPGDGWVPLPATLTAPGTATGNKYTFNASIDLTSLIVPGQKLKFTQNGTTHNFSVVTVSSTQLVLYLLDASTVDTSAITLPYFSVGQAPAGAIGVGPLVVDTGDDVFALYYTPDGWQSESLPAWGSANAAAMTRTANTYANMSAAGYVARQLPFRALYNNGLAWQFRWTGGVQYGSGQTAAGVRLTAIAADLGAAGAQDTTNIFGEVTSFTANAELVKDSAWVLLNPSVALKDMIALMPQFKSDGTRTVTISQADPFSVRCRVVFP